MNGRSGFGDECKERKWSGLFKSSFCFCSIFLRKVNYMVTPSYVRTTTLAFKAAVPNFSSPILKELELRYTVDVHLG